MKKRTGLFLVLIAVCLATFFGYRMVKRLGTDTKAPTIHMNSGVQQISVQASKSALLQGITAEDDTDGDVTASLVVESIRLTDPHGKVTVSYAAFDRAGNVAKASRQVQYTDYHSPRFSLETPLVFPQTASVDVLGRVRVTDLLDGDITRRVRATSLAEDSVANFGTHEVEFRVSNSLGDTVSLTLPVEVHAAGAYQASVTLTDYLIYLPVGADFESKAYLESFTTGNERTSLKNGVPKGLTLKTTGTVDTQKPGVYSVGYTVTYTQPDSGNSGESRSYSGYSKLIVVVEE